MLLDFRSLDGSTGLQSPAGVEAEEQRPGAETAAIVVQPSGIAADDVRAACSVASAAAGVASDDVQLVGAAGERVAAQPVAGDVADAGVALAAEAVATAGVLASDAGAPAPAIAQTAFALDAPAIGAELATLSASPAGAEFAAVDVGASAVQASDITLSPAGIDAGVDAVGSSPIAVAFAPSPAAEQPDLGAAATLPGVRPSASGVVGTVAVGGGGGGPSRRKTAKPKPAKKRRRKQPADEPRVLVAATRPVELDVLVAVASAATSVSAESVIVDVPAQRRGGEVDHRLSLRDEALRQRLAPREEALRERLAWRLRGRGGGRAA